MDKVDSFPQTIDKTLDQYPAKLHLEGYAFQTLLGTMAVAVVVKIPFLIPLPLTLFTHPSTMFVYLIKHWTVQYNLHSGISFVCTLSSSEQKLRFGCFPVTNSTRQRFATSTRCSRFPLSWKFLRWAMALVTQS